MPDKVIITYSIGSNVLPDRFWTKVFVNPHTNCWEWTAGKTGRGYGAFWPTPRAQKSAHRYCYEAFHGKVDQELHMDHLCRNIVCVNPAHLEPVTPKVNSDRGEGPCGIHARKQCCPKCGSDYSLDGKGGRFCKPCQNEWHKLNNRKKRASGVSYKASIGEDAYRRHLEYTKQWGKANRDKTREAVRRYKAKKKAERITDPERKIS